MNNDTQKEVTITAIKKNIQKHINRTIQQRLNALLERIAKSSDIERKQFAEKLYASVLDQHKYYKKVYRLFDLLNIELSATKWKELVERCNSIFWIRENFINAFILNPNSRSCRRVLKCQLLSTLDDYYYKRFASAFVCNYQELEIHHEILDELMTSAGAFQDIIQEIA